MKRLHYGWVMVIVSAVIFAVIAARFYTFGVFLVPLQEAFGWNRGSISLAASSAAVIGGIISLFIGRLSDRYGPRTLVTVAGVLHVAGFFLAASISQLWQLYLVWGLIMGTGNACSYIPLMSAIARWFSARRTTAIGITITGFASGAILWPPLTQWIIDTWNWQRAFVVLGILSGITIIPLAQFLKTSPERVNLMPYGVGGSSTTQTPAKPSITLRQAVRTPQFWVWSMIEFGFFTSLSILFVHIVAHARDIGIPPVFAASTLSFIAGSSIIARLTVGSFSEKLGTRVELIGATALGVASFLVLVLSPYTWTFYLFALVFGLAYGSIVPLETAVPAEIFGLGSLGSIMAAVSLFPMVGSALGPPIAGLIFDRTQRYQPVFIACLVLAIAALALSIVLHRLKEKHPSAHQNKQDDVLRAYHA